MAIIFTMLVEFFKQITNFVAQIPFDILVWSVWGSYLAVFLISLFATLFSKRAKDAEKKPFLCLTNAYTGVNLAVFLLLCSIEQSIIASALFWVIGYLLYGLLCLCSADRKKAKSGIKPAPEVKTVYTPPAAPVKNQTPAAKNSVRLEHAVTVTDSLLTKNLAKSDRQELEKLKNTLAVLQIKGTLTPTESDILNDNFNALLKLMAKYNA